MLRIIVSGIVRALLHLRYTVELRGYEEVQRDPSKALVLLPNHPAEMDPLILMGWLYPKCKQRPLVVEKFYYIKGFAWIMRLAKAIPIPDLKVKPSSWNLFKTQQQMQRILSLCEEKESLLIYPAGILKITGKEELGASAICHQLIQSDIPIQLLLIRTTGLWGSKFSRFLDGQVPEFNKTLAKGVILTLLNGLFFLPKRKVVIEFKSIDSKEWKQLDRNEVNRNLENWYNQYPTEINQERSDTEPLMFVPYLFYWRFQQRFFPPKPKKMAAKAKSVPPEFRKEIDAFLLTLTKKDRIDWTEESGLGRNLNLDSLDLAELWIFLSKKYNLGGMDVESITTVGDVYQVAIQKQPTASHEIIKRKAKLCESPAARAPAYPENAQTLLSAFYETAIERKKQAICADRFSGVLTYNQLVRAICLLAEEIKQASRGKKGEKIGVLLPSSVGAYIVILSVLLAGKIPVMLNWTLGKKHLEDCVLHGKIATILSSERFLLELTQSELGSICENIVLLEDLKQKISLGKILKLLLAGSFAHFKRGITSLHAHGQEEAVILFTSGTEGPPKMVPLTHNNLIANHRAAIHRIPLFKEDLFYSMLPPFHSFGFSVTGLLPLLAGMRVFYEANPTQSLKVVEDLIEERPTILCSPPSFLRPILAEAKDRQAMLALRLVVAGAEAMPQDLFDLAKSFSFTLIEGYGITECSPIVSLQKVEPNPPTFKKYLERGIGQPLEGIEIKIIDYDTKILIPEGKEGEICVAGKNVFNGYANLDVQTCFVQLDNKKFYLTGDRGKIQQGTLYLTGRYKRFVKIGGEMIHLGTIEQMLLEIIQAEEGSKTPVLVPILAVVGSQDSQQKTQIFVFTTKKLEKAHLQEALRAKGLSPLFKIDQLIQLDAIPLTGTGKIDYLYLENSAKTKSN